MPFDQGPFWTVARIARKLGVERHRVENIIKTRNIDPLGTAGMARVFDESVVTRIDDELKAIDARRQGVVS